MKWLLMDKNTHNLKHKECIKRLMAEDERGMLKKNYKRVK